VARKPRAIRDTSSPLAFLLDLMRDPALSDELRLQAAIGAAPYCHPTRQITENRQSAPDRLDGHATVPRLPN